METLCKKPVYMRARGHRDKLNIRSGVDEGKGVVVETTSCGTCHVHARWLCKGCDSIELSLAPVEVAENQARVEYYLLLCLG